ncbi:CubicO group peptidase (beta-lactamase class C family) [Paenibacillus rhizosphaerae]|uniref:CubicO group peptidase (Beta-lactamase class C family) n=1 Tax=Paenibacillus rhizosphaerae TaxID=297318 RepID=A0A839U0M7_9BACL|nr:serine hydrolase [Paenibacillus rhizosphaerae]MBB3132251.1 CubicO group peptidase (beta-lactamase class C family) [Paenibacillus rhizosphaerae]
MEASSWVQADTEIIAKYPNVLSMVILRNGAIVHERYYRNTGPEDAFPVMSVNKSILSALVGIALNKGIISDLDRYVLDFFPEMNRKDVDPQTSRLTLRHLLTMSSGFYYPRLAGDAQPIWERTMRSRHWVEFSLTLPVRDVMGQQMVYKNTDALLLAACLCRSTSRKIGEIAQEWLFEPLELSINPWHAEDPQQLGIGILSMTGRDMATIGQLYLQQGMWSGRQLIPKEWIHASTSRQIGNYGFLWWVEEDGYSASGAGGSLIRVIPEQSMVVVFQTKHLKRFKDPREIVDRLLK